MDKVVLDQLKKAKGIIVKDTSGNNITNIEDYDNIIIEKYVDDRNKLYSDIEYEFEFDSTVVKPRVSNIRAVPLMTMRGLILDKNSEIVYIKVVGIIKSFSKCQHCLRFGNYSPLCENCIKILDMNNISWEGWMPLTAIKRITKI